MENGKAAEPGGPGQWPPFIAQVMTAVPALSQAPSGCVHARFVFPGPLPT
jgi:hypothetical protein